MRSKNWWLAFLIIFTFGAIFYLGLNAIEDFDVWWHLKSGAVILEQGFPHTDIFSATTPQQPWFPYEWLGELCFYTIYLFGGLNALIVFKSLVTVLTWGLVFFFLRKQGIPPPIALAAVALGFTLTLTSWPPRPLIFSFLFFTAFNIVLFSEPRRHYLLPLILLPWANFHPSFYLGFVALTLYYTGYFLDQKFSQGFFSWSIPKTYLALLAASALAILCHPQGGQIFIYPLSLVSNRSFMSGLDEWQPAPFLDEPLFYLTLIVTGFVILWCRDKSGWRRALPLLFFGLYATTASRHIPLFALLTALVLPVALHQKTSFFRPLFSMLASLVTLIILGGVLIFFWPLGGKLGVQPDCFPEKAVSFIESQQLAGPMYNAYDWGGYLIWRLYPRIKTFVDGRNSSEAMFNTTRELLEAVDYQARLDAFGINFILTNSTYVNSGRLFPLIEALAGNPRWVLIYQDAASLLFVRDSAENQPLIRQYQRAKTDTFRQVIAEAKRRLRENPDLPFAYLAQGKGYLELREFPAAKENLRRALKINPRLGEAQTLLDLLKDWEAGSFPD